jgi:hypothetical protein
MLFSNPPPNWKHDNAAACGEAFVCPSTASATHKEPFHQDGRAILLLKCDTGSPCLFAEPMLYLSLYFKTHRQYYYELLNEVA